MFNKNYVIYLLKNTCNNRTYLGITNNFSRRILQQHNGIIKGGTPYTKRFKETGEWIYHLKITNLTKNQALSIERNAKNKRKGSKEIKSIDKRLNVLLPLLSNYPEVILTYIKEDDSSNSNSDLLNPNENDQLIQQ